MNKRISGLSEEAEADTSDEMLGDNFISNVVVEARGAVKAGTPAVAGTKHVDEAGPHQTPQLAIERHDLDPAEQMI